MSDSVESRDPILEKRLREDQVDRLLSQAVLLMRQGQTSEALKRCKEAMELAPNSAAVWEVLGDVYLSTFHYPQAMEAYRTGLKLDPKRAVLEEKLGRASLAQLDSEQLRARTREILETGEAHKKNIRRAYEIAVSLSVLWPGLGQIRNNQYAKGLLMLTLQLCLLMAMIHLFMASLAEAKVRAVDRRPPYARQVSSFQQFLGQLGRAWSILRENRAHNTWFWISFFLAAINYGGSIIDAGIGASHREEEELL